MNMRNKVVKVVSLVLATYMAVSPMVVYADEPVEVENNTIADTAVVVENNTIADTAVLVESEINNIENEAIREAANAIVNVDMSGVDEALVTVTEIVDAALTDEVVAAEIETTADALISIYETQSGAALDALTVIANESENDAVEVLEDGSVSVDWDMATEEVQALYDTYQKAEEAMNTAAEVKATAEETMKKANEDKTAASNKVEELSTGVISENKEASEKISKSKASKDEKINELIASYESLKKDFKKDYTKDGKVADSNDMYRFFINIVENGVAYGCLTYYDADSKTILRKNFTISSEGIDYNYAPESKWVKEDKDCQKVVFGNGGNYIAAYVGDSTSPYIKASDNTFDGSKVSTLMRANVGLNDAIVARNEALNELMEIENVVAKAEQALEVATTKANDALESYRVARENYEKAVAKYDKVASLENEMKKDEMEIAKLEYVKAEVEAFRKQQVLNRVNEAINNTATAEVAETEEIAQENENVENNESIEVVVNTIARNLGVAPAAVEALVVQTIMETEDSYIEDANNAENVVAAAGSAVAGERRIEETVVNTEVEETEEIVDTQVSTNKEVVEEAIDAQYEGQDLVTIEENEIALANVGADTGYRINWLPLIFALACADWFLFVVAKRKEQKEEVNR